MVGEKSWPDLSSAACFATRRIKKTQNGPPTKKNPPASVWAGRVVGDDEVLTRTFSLWARTRSLQTFDPEFVARWHVHCSIARPTSFNYLGGENENYETVGERRCVCPYLDIWGIAGSWGVQGHHREGGQRGGDGADSARDGRHAGIVRGLACAETKLGQTSLRRNVGGSNATQGSGLRKSASHLTLTALPPAPIRFGLAGFLLPFP